MRSRSRRRSSPASTGARDGGHHRGAVAGALQGAGLGERLPDRQPGSQPSCRCRPRPSRTGGTSSTSPPTAARTATTNTGTTLRKLIWQIASPRWEFDVATFDRTAAAFDNPDYVAIVIHNYRWRHRPGRRRARNTTTWRSGWRRLPVIGVPTITLEGDANGAPHAGRPPPTRASSPASTSNGSSRAASATTSRKRLRRHSPRPSWTSTALTGEGS